MEENLERDFTKVEYNNTRKIKIPDVKKGLKTIRIKLLNSDIENDSTNYIIEVEPEYCIRMKKEGDAYGFSFSPRTEDPIVFKDTHLTVTVSTEGEDVYVILIAPNKYYIVLADELQVA